MKKKTRCTLVVTKPTLSNLVNVCNELRVTGEISITIDTKGFLPLDPNDEEHQKAAASAYDYNVTDPASGPAKTYGV